MPAKKPPPPSPEPPPALRKLESGLQLQLIKEIDLHQRNAGALWIGITLLDGRIVRVEAVIRGGVLDVSYEVLDK